MPIGTDMCAHKCICYASWQCAMGSVLLIYHCLLEPASSSNQLLQSLLKPSGICLMSFTLSVALRHYFQSGCMFQRLYVSSISIHEKARRFLYRLLPGNLGQRSVTISTLFVFISLVTSIIRACDTCMRLMVHDPIMLS